MKLSHALGVASLALLTVACTAEEKTPVKSPTMTPPVTTAPPAPAEPVTTTPDLSGYTVKYGFADFLDDVRTEPGFATEGSGAVLSDTDEDSYQRFRSKSMAVQPGTAYAFCVKMQDRDLDAGFPAVRISHVGTGAAATLIANDATSELSLREHMDDSGYAVFEDTAKGYCLSHPGRDEALRVYFDVFPAASIGFPGLNKAATGQIYVSDASLYLSE